MTLFIILGLIMLVALGAVYLYRKNKYSLGTPKYRGSATDEDQLAHYQNMYETQRHYNEVTRWGGGL